MLHTLNRAWAKILVNQAVNDTHKKFLFVTATKDELFDTIDMLWPLLPVDVKAVHIKVQSLDELKQEIAIRAYYGESFEIYDDILISHELTDIFIKDFLNKHCKRKCC